MKVESASITHDDLKQALRPFLFAAIGWTLLVAVIASLDINHMYSHSRQLAIREAQANFNKDQAFRYWGASHGGVYVPVTDNTPPNRYLTHLEERDIVTPSGKKLTLMNPAYMVRQMNEYFGKLYGIYGHITSLKLLNPGNMPDTWERKALESFDKGNTEQIEFTEIDGKPFLRLMKPMIVQKGCLNCHAHQGYKEGDVRGGVGVAVPLEGLYADRNKELRSGLVRYATIWLLGLMGIIVSGRKVKIQTEKRIRVENALMKSYEEMERHVEERTQELKVANIELGKEIEKHKQSVEEMRESEAKFRAVAETAHDAVVTASAQGNIVSWNKSAERIFGYSADEIMGKPLTLIIPERYREAHLHGFQRLLEGGERRVIGRTVELEGLKKGGEEFPLELSIASWVVRGKTYFTAIIHNITGRKRAEENLKTTHELLSRQEKLVSIGTLSSGVAHEILNPLNIIGTIVQVMQLDNLSEEMQENTDEIMKQIKRATKITNNLRMFAHQKKAEIEPVDIHDLFDKTASLIEHDLNLENIQIDRMFNAEVPVINADEDQLAQVFLNLLNNAKDAMKGRKHNLINVKTDIVKNGIEISFSDNGPGMPPDILKQIFDPFFTTKNPDEGTGLGLSMVFSIIERHGGTIRVESEEGKGATFHLTLPINPPKI